jgi:hypothetical protein
MADPNEDIKLTEEGANNGVLQTAAPVHEVACMYCGADDTKGNWECVHTGDEESFEGWEDWFCCHVCRDAAKPCETFHKIPFPVE